MSNWQLVQLQLPLILNPLNWNLTFPFWHQKGIKISIVIDRIRYWIFRFRQRILVNYGIADHFHMQPIPLPRSQFPRNAEDSFDCASEGWDHKYIPCHDSKSWILSTILTPPG